MNPGDTAQTGKITLLEKFERKFLFAGQAVQNRAQTHELVVQESGYYLIFYSDDGIFVSLEPPTERVPYIDLSEYDL